MKSSAIKKATAMLLCLIMVLAVAACGNNAKNNENQSSESKETASSNEPTATQESSPQKEPQTIVLSTFNSWWNSATIQKAVQMYESETGNKIEPNIYPDDQFGNILKTQLATGQGPDIFAAWPKVTDYDLSQLEPLTGEWTQKIDLEYAKNTGYASRTDGKFYTAPYGAAYYYGMLYNKDIFARAGIQVPIKTYQELVAAAEKIKEMGITPIHIPNKEAWAGQFIYIIGSGFVALNNPKFSEIISTNKGNFKDIPEMVQLFDRVDELKEKGLMNKDLQSATWAMTMEALTNGTAAMTPIPDNAYQDIEKSFPGKTPLLGFTAFNMGDDPAQLSIYKDGSGNGLYIPKASKNKEAAMEFIDYVMSEKVMTAMYEIQPGVNELGYKTKTNIYDAELQGLLDSGTAKMNDSFLQAVGRFDPTFEFTLGNQTPPTQAHLAGKSTLNTFTDWYTEYAKLNKAAGKNPNFK